jgi:NAD(P)-dependent dehydrogenase (short-subunit alcohol dehydrogenase family)
MSKPWILVSPSSRGIGHAVTARLLGTTKLPILATARSAGDLFDVKASLLSSALSLSPSSSSSSFLSPSSKKFSSSLYSYSENVTAKQEEEREKEDMASRLHVTQLDVTLEDSVSAAAEKAAQLFPPGTHHLHLAFALPGILRPEKSLKGVDYDQAVEVFRVNTLGPLLLMKWFGDLLPRRGTDMSFVRTYAEDGNGNDSGNDRDNSHDDSKNVDENNNNNNNPLNPVSSPPLTTFHLPAHATFLTASARLGSTTDNELGGWYTYRASKAAVNSLVKTFDLHLQARSGANAIVAAYHPGTVKTDFTKRFWGTVPPKQLFSAEFAAYRMLKVVEGLRVNDRGRCWDWKGEEVLL